MPAAVIRREAVVIHELENELFYAADLLPQAAMTGDLFFGDDAAELFSHPVIGIVHAATCWSSSDLMSVRIVRRCQYPILQSGEAGQ